MNCQDTGLLQLRSRGRLIVVRCWACQDLDRPLGTCRECRGFGGWWVSEEDGCQRWEECPVCDGECVDVDRLYAA